MSFIESVEGTWKAKGLDIEADDSDEVFSRYATKDRYSLRVIVNLPNKTALIEGSGPCVDDPNAD